MMSRAIFFHFRGVGESMGNATLDAESRNVGHSFCEFSLLSLSFPKKSPIGSLIEYTTSLSDEEL